MLKINETVVYGTTGVCTVEKIEEKKIGREIKQYYVLRPVAQKRAAVFLPADNEMLLNRIRSVICRESALKLLDSMDSIVSEWIESDNERRIFCQNAISSGSFEDRISVIKMLKKQRSVLSAENKRLHIVDERSLSEAERLVCDELAVALGSDVSEILGRINAFL